MCHLAALAKTAFGERDVGGMIEITPRSDLARDSLFDTLDLLGKSLVGQKQKGIAVGRRGGFCASQDRGSLPYTR